MTLMYKLFGVPKNMGEFIEYSKKNGNNLVELKVEQKYDNEMYFRTCTLFVNLYYGKKKMEINRSAHILSNNSSNNKLLCLIYEAAIKEAIKAAEVLNKNGLKSTRTAMGIGQPRQGLEVCLKN